MKHLSGHLFSSKEFNKKMYITDITKCQSHSIEYQYYDRNYFFYKFPIYTQTNMSKIIGKQDMLKLLLSRRRIFIGGKDSRVRLFALLKASYYIKSL